MESVRLFRAKTNTHEQLRLEVAGIENVRMYENTVVYDVFCGVFASL